MPNSLKCRLKGLVRKGLLSEKDLSRIYTDNDVIAELEKIKAEIKQYGSIMAEWNDDMAKEEIVESVLKQSKECVLFVLDNHISELKGENK